LLKTKLILDGGTFEVVRHEVACGEWLRWWRSVMSVAQLGPVFGPVPALTCVASDGGVRSSGFKPKDPRSVRGSQVRGRPDG
jgi:hypothetical protein